MTASTEQKGRIFEFPATPTEAALWVLNRMNPGSTAYNIPLAAVVRGALDHDRLRNAVEVLTRRHDVLRTVFVERDGALMQRLLPAVDLEWSVRTSPAPAPGESELRALVETQVRRLFDLEAGPLIRGAAWSWGDEEHAFCLVLHHIVVDHLALGKLVQELAALYAGRDPGPVPELQFPDYSVWLDTHVLPTIEASGLATWTRLLEGFSGVLALPTDRPRGAGAAGEGREIRFPIQSAVAEQTRAFARASGVSLFNVLLAGLQVLLAKHTGQADIVVGTPFANRGDDQRLDDVVGCFINTVPIPVMVEGDGDFRALVRRCREVVLQAHEHQAVPFMSIVGASQARRDASLNPLFQVGFVFQDPPEVPELPGLEVRELPVHSGGAMYDLHLWLWEDAEAFGGLVWYDTALFDAATVERFAARYEHLLGRLVSDPEAPLSAHEAGTPSEYEALAAWNATRREAPDAPASVWHAIRQALRSDPEQTAVVATDGRLTGRQLHDQADRIAQALMRRGATAGGMVGISLARGRELLPALLGVMGTGAAYLPLDPDYPADRLQYMVETSGVELVVCSPDNRAAVTALGAQPVTVAELLAEAGEATEPPGPGPDALMYVIFTSGSTGRPKGVMVPHACVRNFLSSMRERPGLGAEDRLLAVTTLSFDIAVLELYLPLLAGGTVVLATSEQARDGRALRSLLEAEAITVLQATPSTWRVLLDAGWQGEGRLKALCGGEALPGPLAAELVGRVGELWNMYGPTETTVWSTMERIEAESPVTIGRPIHNTTCHVLDRDGMRQPIGVPGELWIGGAGVTRGYLGRDDLTAERFVDDPSVPGGRRYRTGDLVRYRPDGRLEHLGRLDHQVKVNGHRIELGEIEAVLGGHPSVGTCVVTAIGEPGAGARLVAFFTAEGMPPMGNELRTYLRNFLPDYMVPGIVTELDALPLTPNGKVDRRALPDPRARRGRASRRGDDAPRGALEELVAEEWTRRLSLASVSASDNFFELGGNSLLAIQVAAALEGRLERQVDPRAMFFDTLRQFARTLEAPGGRAP